MWQSGEQVEVDVCNPRHSQVANVIENSCPVVQAPNRCRLLVAERLHPQTYAIHAAGVEGFEHSGSQCSRSTFHRNLRPRLHDKILPNRDKQSLEKRNIKYSRSSTTQ